MLAALNHCVGTELSLISSIASRYAAIKKKKRLSRGEVCAASAHERAAGGQWETGERTQGHSIKHVEDLVSTVHQITKSFGFIEFLQQKKNLIFVLLFEVLFDYFDTNLTP